MKDFRFRISDFGLGRRFALPKAFLNVACVLAVGAAAFAVQSRGEERVIAGYTTPLAGRSGSQRHNARLALKHLSGAQIAPGEVFSFNQRVGSFSKDEGYRKAPVSYNGQLINSFGGGVCQTSTTLYNAALLAGMHIVERHRHNFCPSYVPPGQDAAVAFSNIDLRFENPYDFPVKISGRLSGDRLTLEFLASRSLPMRPVVLNRVSQVVQPTEFDLGVRGRTARVRNSGKPGYDVQVFRVVGDRQELISSDTYPAMNRVIQFDP